MLRRSDQAEVNDAPPAPRRILLADENAGFLEEVLGLLGDAFVILGECTSGFTLLEEAARLKPDIIVLDLSLGDLTGIEAIRKLRQRGSQATIVVLSMHENPDFARAALAAGASAYVFKSTLRTDLLPAIDAALGGDIFVSHRIA